MAETLYIPPPGVCFRLLGYVTQQVLFSRTHEQPEVWHHPVQSEHQDQYFSLVPLSENQEGFYALQGKVSDKFLVITPARTLANEDDEGSPASWFKLEAGEGKTAKMFRITCPALDMVIFSRTHMTPHVSATSPISNKWDDQYFSFVFEDLQVNRVEYDLARATIADRSLVQITVHTFTNNTSHEQQMTISSDLPAAQTFTWKYSSGFPLGDDISFKGKLKVGAWKRY
ncbi:Hemolytic lectin LSLb [Mycena indigotica]|uniref:Hemolytic lectin LSLb n=1 Tax=Mycena indigotica TaxID=2126181 RepID=A0A8H6SPE1_9AGAR|nr:Hemolytic lectin LSLb [Mycena indigotica]KAF7301947.1 Hemolytic lectin LSLb [Mycena indigotica]